MSHQPNKHFRGSGLANHAPPPARVSSHGGLVKADTQLACTCTLKANKQASITAISSRVELNAGIPRKPSADDDDIYAWRTITY